MHTIDGMATLTKAIQRAAQTQSGAFKTVGSAARDFSQMLSGVSAVAVLDPSKLQMLQMSPEARKAEIVNDILNRGSVFRAFRIAIPR